MKIICAVDENWNIGKDKGLLFYIRKDMERFKELTTNNIVVMGRKTLESLPKGQALLNRENIVITRNKNYGKNNVIVYNSIKEFLTESKNMDKDIFVIGGGEIIRELLYYCEYALITKIVGRVDDADTSIPNLDLDENFKLLEESESLKDGGVEFKYVKYGNINTNKI